MQQIDEVAVRKRIEQYRKKYGVPLLRIGEVLGSKSGSVAGKTMLANRYLADEDASFSLRQMNDLAAFMGISVHDLLFAEGDNKNDRAPLDTRVPLLGDVSAAVADWVVDDVQGWIEYPFGTKKQQIFALKVAGECMSPRFMDGDIVFVRSAKMGTETPAGTVVVAQLGREKATLKKFYHRDGVVDLVPQNDAFAPIRVEGEQLADLSVIGVVVGHLSRVGE